MAQRPMPNNVPNPRRNTGPPRLVQRLLERLTAPHLREEILGDLDELFEKHSQRYGHRKARLLYILDILLLVHPRLWTRKPITDLKPQYSNTSTYPSLFIFHPTMIRNYLKIAWRNLLKNKGYSAINIAGLSVGLAVAMLIGLWVQHQYAYDTFLSNYQLLYQVKRNFNSNGDTLTFNSTSLKLADALRTQIPEIESVAESDFMGSHGLRVGNNKIYSNGAQIGSDFLTMFDYPLVAGNAASVLREPYSIVLTESTAKALFGQEDPMGKIVRFDTKNDLKVTGILKDVPANSSLQFNFLVPFSYYEATDEDARSARKDGFGANGYQIFVKLKPGSSYAQIAPKIASIEKTETTSLNAMNSVVILQALQNWHLYSTYENGKETGGFIEYVRLFSIIGILVLLIACINFINLTTARSTKRAKEVGIRKAVGSKREQLIVQFLLESGLLTFMAVLVSLLLIQLLMPAFNALTGDPLAIPYASAGFWLLLLGGALGTALLAGSMPAFYLSSLQPIKVLKGVLSIGSATSWPRKVLVVAQFSCSLVLIISALLIYRQIQYAKNRPTGYDVNRLMATAVNTELGQQYTALKEELLQNQIAESVSQSSSPATDIWWHSDLDQWAGKTAGETVEMGIIRVREDYFNTVGMHFQQGRDFAGDADTMSVILNQTAINRLRLKHPVGQSITWQGRIHRIVGVVKDALMLSPFGKADPTMFVYSLRPLNVLLYRIAPNRSTQDALTRLKALFTKYNPSYAYSYQFVDATYAAKFKLELLVGTLAGLFASLAIFISCLGLLGLASFTAEQRTKEIGVRKVLGASVLNLLGLLSKDFVGLIIISFLIASPMAYYFLNDWLQQYAYRTELSWWIFVVSGVGVLLVTLLTVSSQSIRAALMNPVKSLRSE